MVAVETVTCPRGHPELEARPGESEQRVPGASNEGPRGLLGNSQAASPRPLPQDQRVLRSALRGRHHRGLRGLHGRHRRVVRAEEGPGQPVQDHPEGSAERLSAGLLHRCKWGPPCPPPHTHPHLSAPVWSALAGVSPQQRPREPTAPMCSSSPALSTLASITWNPGVARQQSVLPLPQATPLP